MAKKMLLARHASTGTRNFGRFIGSSDIPLGENAAEEIARLASVIAEYRPTATFCSPMQRAVRTADMLAERTMIGAIHVTEDLREVDFGRWEGLSFDEIAENDSELVKRWSIWSPEFTFPDGEAIADFLGRTGSNAEKLASCPEETILVVAHGGVVRAMLCHLLGLPTKHYLLFDVKPARLATLDLFPEGGVLTGLNL